MTMTMITPYSHRVKYPPPHLLESLLTASLRTNELILCAARSCSTTTPCGMCAVAFCKGVILCNLIFALTYGSSKYEINYTCVHSTGDDKELEVTCSWPQYYWQTQTCGRTWQGQWLVNVTAEYRYPVGLYVARTAHRSIHLSASDCQQLPELEECPRSTQHCWVDRDRCHGF